MALQLVSRISSYLRQLNGPRAVTPEEIEGALRLPVLTIIPHLERRQDALQTPGRKKREIHLDGRWLSRLLTHFPENSAAYAAYNALLEELKNFHLKQGRSLFLVTSPVASEGTSLTCVNLAIAASKKGIKTLVVEGHIRSPRISMLLSLALEPGLTGSFHRASPISSLVQKSSLAGIDILPAGRPVEHPQSLWSSEKFERLLEGLRKSYPLILFEAGPVLLYPDTAVLAKKMDGIILVHQFGRTSAERIQKALEKLNGSREAVLGLVVNDAPFHH